MITYDDLLIGWSTDFRARFFHRVVDSGYNGPIADVSACEKGWLQETTTHREAVPEKLQPCRRCFPRGYQAWLLGKLAAK